MITFFKLGEQSDEEIDEEDYIDGEEDKDLDVKSIDTSNFQPGLNLLPSSFDL